MKTKLLSFIITTVLFTSAMNAQTKVWDLGGNVAPWNITATTTGYPSSVIVDNLGIEPGAGITNFGIIEAHVKTFSTSPSYTSVNRWKTGGSGSAPVGTNLPVQRFLYFKAAGSVTVEILFLGAGSSSRTLYVTDGTNVLGSATIADSTTPQILTTTAATVNGNVYIYGDNGMNFYRIKVTGPLGTTTLGTSDFQQDSSVKVFAVKKQVSISNVVSNTEVNVYNMTGALVKTVKTNTDTSFDLLNSGIYIVNVKSEEGQKSVKVLVQ